MDASIIALGSISWSDLVELSELHWGIPLLSLMAALISFFVLPTAIFFMVKAFKNGKFLKLIIHAGIFIGLIVVLVEVLKEIYRVSDITNTLPLFEVFVTIGAMIVIAELVMMLGYHEIKHRRRHDFI